MWILYLILGIILCLAIFVWGFCEYFFKKSFARVEKDELTKTVADFDEKFQSGHLSKHFGGILHGRDFVKNTPYEERYVTSHDGYKLYARLYKAEAPRATVILCHGFRSHGTHDFAMIVEHYIVRKFNVLLISERAHVESESKYIGFGQLERFDIKAWRETIDGPVLIHGLSMGATTVLMAAELDLPKNVKGIIADCGFTSPHAIWKHVAENNLKRPYGLYSAAAKDLCRRKILVASDAYSTTEALKNAGVPVLFIHGTDDKFVPIEMTFENYKACSSEKRLFIVPGAEHGMSYLEDKAGYEQAVINFWSEFDKK